MVWRLGSPGLADEDLPDDRLALLRGRADHGVVGRHVAPAEELLAFVADDLLEELLAALAVLRVLRQEDHADAVVAERRQVQAESRGFLLEEAVRHLHEDAGAVAGVGLAAAGAAVLQIVQDLQGLLDDPMGACGSSRSATKPTPQASCSYRGS